MATHPLHALGFEPLTSSLTDLGFEPQRIVRPRLWRTREPDSGRKIVQPTDNPAVNQALATDAMPAYKARLAGSDPAHPRGHAGGEPRCQESAAPGGKDRAAGPTGRDGKRLRRGPDRGRLAASERCGRGRGETALHGIAASRITSPSAIREYHYRSYSLQVQMPNGASEELQIVPRPVLAGQSGRSTTTTSRRATRSSQAGARNRPRRPREPSTTRRWSDLTPEME